MEQHDFPQSCLRETLFAHSSGQKCSEDSTHEDCDQRRCPVVKPKEIKGPDGSDHAENEPAGMPTPDKSPFEYRHFSLLARGSAGVLKPELPVTLCIQKGIA